MHTERLQTEERVQDPRVEKARAKSCCLEWGFREAEPETGILAKLLYWGGGALLKAPVRGEWSRGRPPALGLITERGLQSLVPW